MKVAIDILPGIQAGVGRWQRESIKALDAEIGHEIRGVTAFSYGKRFRRPDWLPPRVGYVENRLPGRVQQFLSSGVGMPIEWVCGLGDSDVVFAMNLHPLRSRSPIVLAVADVSWRVYNQQYRTTFNAEQIRLAESAIKQADHILTLSRYSASELVQGGVSADRITVAPLGVGNEFWSGIDHVERVRSKYDLPSEFVVYVGGINERKNIRVLVQALESLGGRAPLIIAGPPPPEPLQYWGLERPWIRHLGYLPDHDVPGLFAAATMKVFPSALEGYGIPLVEAMAAGTMVIAADTPVFREVGGGAVCYYPSHDSVELARLILAALESGDVRSDYASRGREWVSGVTTMNYRAGLVSALECGVRAKRMRPKIKRRNN